MSLASCSYQCGWIADDVTFTVSMIGNNGDLFQRYTGSAVNPDTITPNWDGTALGAGPVIRNILMESDPTITQATLAAAVVDSETTYYIDGLKLEFNTSGISIDSTSGGATGYAGCFRKLLANKNGTGTPVPTLSSAPFGGLEIRKNLVTPTNGKTINVSVKLGIDAGSKGLHKQGSTRIRMIQSNGATNFAHIYCTGDSFVLDEDHDSVTCKVRCWEGDTEVTTFYRKWYMLEGGQWVQKSTANDFVVDRSMVATFADIKVECYSDSACTKKIASDVQTVNDSTDAYIISPSPNPPDGTYLQGGNVDLTFSPKLTNNDGSAVTEAHKFIYAVMDSVGNIVQSVTAANAIPMGGSFTVAASIANNMGEGPIVNIEAINA